MTDTSNRSRQAAGQKIGGQFKAKQHSEGGVELGDRPVSSGIALQNSAHFNPAMAGSFVTAHGDRTVAWAEAVNDFIRREHDGTPTHQAALEAAEASGVSPESVLYGYGFYEEAPSVETAPGVECPSRDTIYQMLDSGLVNESGLPLVRGQRWENGREHLELAPNARGQGFPEAGSIEVIANADNTWELADGSIVEGKHIARELDAMTDRSIVERVFPTSTGSSFDAETGTLTVQMPDRTISYDGSAQRIPSDPTNLAEKLHEQFSVRDARNALIYREGLYTNERRALREGVTSNIRAEEMYSRLDEASESTHLEIQRENGLLRVRDTTSGELIKASDDEQGWASASPVGAFHVSDEAKDFVTKHRDDLLGLQKYEAARESWRSY